MAQNIELIQNELTTYSGFTSGEKEYCREHLTEWISENGILDIMIDKMAEKSLDARPFLEKIGLIKDN